MTKSKYVTVVELNNLFNSFLFADLRSTLPEIENLYQLENLC